VDPITTAIVAALPALASDLVKSSVKDAYEGVKSVIRRKWGATSSIAKSVDALEADPKSKRKATVVAKNVTKANATADVEMRQALAKLVDELKKERIGGKAIAAMTINIKGDVHGVVADKVSVGSMNFGVQPRRGKR
jgi:hypothetical protein